MRLCIVLFAIQMTCCPLQADDKFQFYTGAGKYDLLMRRATMIAKTHASLEGTDAKSEQAEMRRTLEKTLNDAFDARQQMQREEIERTRRELDELEKTLAERASRKTDIVANKTRDLLAGNDFWAETTKQETAEPLRSTIQAGDVVAIYLEGVLPYNAPNQPVPRHR
ncbi:MAG: hypothetical protein AAFX06_04220 [Planctomycetota bacterium]